MSKEDPAVVESELSVARRALATRIAHHDDKLAHALLACLYLLKTLHDRLTKDAGAEALDPALGTARELAGAARLITFTASSEDRELPLYPHSWGATPTRPTASLLEDARRLLGEPNSTTRQRGQELLDHLEELLRDVIFTADTQGYVDANANEVAYLRAATRISRAASLVAAACRPAPPRPTR
jgi:hypothetical protein